MAATLPMTANATGDYRRRNARRLKLVLLGLVALAVALALDVSIGPGNLPLADVLRTLVGRDDARFHDGPAPGPISSRPMPSSSHWPPRSCCSS